MANLLMIDDNPQTQKYLERIIRLRTKHVLDFAGDGAEGDEIARGRGVLALDTFNFFILAFWAAIKPLLRATASADLGVPLLFPVISVFGLLPPSPSYLAAFDLKSGGEEVSGM